MQPFKNPSKRDCPVAQSGNNLRVMQVIAGHKRAPATEIYKPTDPEQLKAIIDKLHLLQ